jgi:hypothetical protein
VYNTRKFPPYLAKRFTIDHILYLANGALFSCCTYFRVGYIYSGICPSVCLKRKILFGLRSYLTKKHKFSHLLRAILVTFILLVVYLTTGPKPLPKQTLHIVRSRASSLKWEYPFLSLRSSSSFLRLLPCLPVTYIPPCIFPSVTRCRRQFLHKMWPIQFAFRLCILCRIFLCFLTLSNTSSFLTWSVQLIFFILLQHHISKLFRCFWSIAEASKFQHHIKLRSKCSTSLASSSIPIPMC